MLRMLFGTLTVLLAVVCTAQENEKQTAADDWTVHLDFNRGQEGQRVEGMNAAGRSLYSKEQFSEGGQAAVMHARRGKEEFGRWGGIIKFPSHLNKGDEIWWRVHTYWPQGVDYSAAPRLKFLRIHTSPQEGGNLGYNDIYMNAPGSDVPFQFIYEGAHKWSKIGGREHAVQPETWETYEYYLKLDDKSVAEGGEARVRFWKNGKLLADITDRITLKKPDAHADGAFLFTYWNSSPWTGQIVLAEDAKFEQGETVVSDADPDMKWKVVKAAANTLFMADPSKEWRKRRRPYATIKAGETLTGVTSKASGTVTEVLHTHPVMDIKMYVDDITVTTQRPAELDDQGNPYLGL